MTDHDAMDLVRDDLGLPPALLVNRAAEVNRRTYDDWAGETVREFWAGADEKAAQVEETARRLGGA